MMPRKRTFEEFFSKFEKITKFEIIKFLNRGTFVQLGFNLSNRVTDTLESSSMLIYLALMKSIYRKVLARSKVN
jgi:hypothetical protein